MVPQFSRNFPAIFPQFSPNFPAIFPQFFAIGFDTPQPQSLPPPPPWSWCCSGRRPPPGRLPQVLLAYPAVFELPKRSLKARAAFLRRLGVDVPKVVHRFPQVFGIHQTKMREKVRCLRGMGLDVRRVVERRPTVLRYSAEALTQTFEYLRGLGVDAAAVLNLRPPLFGLAIEGFREKVAFLEGAGLDVPRVVGLMPSVLELSTARNVAPKLAFLTEEMGRSVDEVSQWPAFLGYSLQGRIAPRYRYLRHVDAGTAWALSTFLKSSDAEFAERMAHRSLDEYRRWQSGSPAPS